MTSKLNGELVSKAVDDILAYSAGETIKKGETEIVGKKRKFTESIELQVRVYGWLLPCKAKKEKARIATCISSRNELHQLHIRCMPCVGLGCAIRLL